MGKKNIRHDPYPTSIMRTYQVEQNPVWSTPFGRTQLNSMGTGLCRHKVQNFR